MVASSRETCFIQHKTSPCFDSLDFTNQGGPRADLDLRRIATGVGWGDEEEAGVHVSNDGSSTPVPIATPFVGDFGFGWKPDAFHSVMTNSKDFCSIASAQSGLFVPCRVRTAEGMICASQNGGPAVASKENGLGVAEKRARDDEALDSPARNHSGDLSKRGFQDCWEAPLRKKVHMCENELDDLGRERDEASQAKVSEGNSLTGVDVATKLHGEKLSESEENRRLPARLPPTPLRTEGNCEGGDAEARVMDGDFEISPEVFNETAEDDASGYRGAVPGDEETPTAVTEATDMEVDATSSGNGVAAGTDSPAAEEQGTDVHIYQPSGSQSLGVEILGNYSENAERLNSDTAAQLGMAGSMGVHPHPARSDERRPEDTQEDIPRTGRNVEVIEFDDSDDEPAETNVHESDGSSTKGKPITQLAGQQRRNGYRLPSSESTASSYSPDDDSDSDDCKVIGSRQPQYGQRDVSPNPVVVEEDEESDSTTDDSDSSDVEVVGGSQSAIRRMWEEAAMRRRMGRAMQSEGSKANGGHDGTVNLDDDRTESQGLAESVATSTYHGSPDSKDQTETSEARGGLDGLVNRADGQQGTSSRGGEEERPVGISRRDRAIFSGYNEADVAEFFVASADSERPEATVSPGADQSDVDNQNLVNKELSGDSEDGEESLSAGAHSESLKGTSPAGANLYGNERRPQVYVTDEGLRNKMRAQQEGSLLGDEAGVSNTSGDILAAKERLKQTTHYRNTDAAEWASRQLEIQRQAAEAKRLRQRKRQEADRKKEMERKQKERIDELRHSQMKEEKSMSLREQLRGQVRVELERIASTCFDFATLLRQLGIPVDGGGQPSTQQVNAAYKKAIFRFHPDRAVASSKGDLRQQVEAEEKFKLILRLRNTLVPVAIDYTHPFR